MKNWFSKSKQTSPNKPGAIEEISDDLMAQISGGAGKGACHTGSLMLGGADISQHVQLSSLKSINTLSMGL